MSNLQELKKEELLEINGGGKIWRKVGALLIGFVLGFYIRKYRLI